MVLNSLPCVLVSLCLVFFSSSPCKARIYTNHWAVRIAGGPEQADHIASKYGYRNLGQIGDLKDYYHFFHSRTIKRSTLFSRGTHSFISMEPKVEWLQQQVVKRRTKRDYKPSYPGPVPYSMHCNDNIHNCQSDMNIVGAWKRGYTGKDVVVTILDDGIERNHPDLIQNYDNDASYDVNGNDMDPMPRYDASNENKHGTRCAGEVAASANNSHCTVGIAYNAKIGGVRMLDGDVTDMVEAKSLSLHPQHIDIYSASWGPDDDGKTVDGPASLARQAFENGIRQGRKGRGSIFVWASGNGGRSRDHCSCDGYTNSIYTISISSTAESGRKPWYLEECASTLTTTYSSGENYDRKIITTDLRQRCTDSHTGTSASAPMAAGIIALALEANPFLTWRDVQHIIVKTSRAGHLSAPDWKTNAAGYNVSHLYGFGLMDAEAMVKEAEHWKQVPPQHICVENADKQIRTIRPEHVVRSVYKATGCTDNANHHVIYLEHVVVRITITHPRRGDLSINLTSPSGTKSQLLANRYNIQTMHYLHAFCACYKAAGDWILEIYDSPSQLRSQKAPGKLKEWSLVLYGTSVHPYSFRNDKPRSLAEPQPDDEYSEEYVGSCHPECGENGCEGPGPQQCITCLHYFLKFKNNTRMCVPECPTGFFRDDKKRCKKCSPLCESCMGSRSDQCSACRPGLYLMEGGNNCVSSCPDGFYLDLDSTMCRKCRENCKKCMSANICTECQTGLSLQGNKCQLSCEPGTYYNGHRRACEKCHSTCATCAGKHFTSCNKCALGYYFEEWRCVSSCSVGHYLAEQTTDNGDVQKCDPTCYACAGPGERNCSTCVSGYNLENGVCVVSTICKDGEYLSKPDKCELCSSTCSKCTGPESKDCISCAFTRLYDNGQCVISCDPGKYKGERQCHLCHHTCLECTDEGPDKCTRCSKDRFGVERYLFEGECRETCPEGYSHSSEGTCDPCPPNCTVCTSTGHCLHCTPSYYPKDGTCAKLECGLGQLHHNYCVTCEEGCQQCLTGQYIIIWMDVCTTSILSMRCARCDDHCETCDASQCYQCEEGFFLSVLKCISCKEGFYADMKQECEPCHSTCRSCGGPDDNDCDSCEDDMFLERGQCISKSKIKCPDGKFLNGEGECEQCDSSCRTCSGHQKDQCDSCQEGMFLTNSQLCVSVCPHETYRNQTKVDVCVSCAVGCASCEGEANYCPRCEEGYIRYKHHCVHHCPAGHFIKDGVCEICPRGCTECDQRGKCSGELHHWPKILSEHIYQVPFSSLYTEDGHYLSEASLLYLSPALSACEEYHFLHEDQCLDDCPKRYFTNLEQNECTPCHSDCAECDGPDEDDCTSCGDYGYVRHNTKCLYSCPPETYLDGCDKSCQTCSGPHPSSCLTCRDNMRKDVNGHCEVFSGCPLHTFTDKDGQCKACHKSCLQCSGADKQQCLSCNPKRLLLNQTCVSTCPGGYYVDKGKQECVQCHVKCASCLGHHSNDCITCKPGLLLLGHSCFTTCPLSYFVDASSRACQECDHTCKECSGSSRFCLSCRDGYFLLKKSGQCLRSCPSNYFPRTLDGDCQRCHPTCETCKDECIVALSYSLFNNDPVTWVHPGLFVFTVIFVLVSLWLAIFLFLQFRQKIFLKLTIKSNGYTKIADDHFTSATFSDSMQAEYCDKEAGQEDEEEEDEDIVYMGRDGMVYRKFKYSLLERDEEGEEVELEYDDMYTLT
uniref:Proprotein convertase subtilisin/kexin type 5b n=1 Tax=Cyprinus carpio TaxID=7962 RepID=A0A8C1PM43_CYPCA